jgi:hypothetical protein
VCGTGIGVSYGEFNMKEKDIEQADHQRELDEEQRMIESEQRLQRRKENAQDHNDADAKSGDHHRSPWEYL